ncbi:RNA polymerase sigma factor [Aliidiomarina shirensis]|uniref:RNA polymerase sigma factor n=1 Tax=Aliidiomarina shirensis TaxID=1048642 RepID=UPI001F542B13|nr:RNA polymerase sigma factor [Aliidiomarina shirensis]
MLKATLHRKQASHKLIERLLAEHDIAIRRFVRIKLGTNQDCDDVMQEVYVRLSQIDDLPQRLADRLDTARSYLIQIANNLLIDRARRAQVRCANMHRGEYETATSLHAPERILSGKRKLQQIDKALAKLKPEKRQAFLLHRVEGLSYREIGDQLSVSVSTVEKYISAALLAIRKTVATTSSNSQGFSKHE